MDQQKLKASFPPTTAASSLDLPIPNLNLDFRMSVSLNPKISLGDSGPWGARNWISFHGGTWSASWGSGSVEAGGQDSQIVNPESLYTYVETNYLLKTNDEIPAYIAVKTTGWRTGPKGVLERLFDPELADAVDAKEYSFRLHVRLETGDSRYAEKLNTGMWIASGARRGKEVIYDAYRVV
ncbi:uncharacterized protein MYCFIDRAFT_131195 [Pseudocercospora fijiensis CIRAD86]|uniref:Uncharacterized protein n=1 Tax=Pseudocercospora fijiensis (strain CIRAD86) TaxID=383855 RepID=M3AMK5_PSEFD|nr:uncharacterized protein MYCFIDRAFT_131195 [Pseudocercospora fijiensis CIRAD86]EME85801.1 hypothetical protein MYCFIDRAFT_131195 [Pseudocercospora fijiensis CIRAD86]